MRRLIFILSIFLFGLVGVAEAKKQIVVDLSKQEAYAYENGRLVFSGWVSTGRPGHRTPTGYFRVLEKDIDHVSSKYPRPNGGAKMYYMLRLTNYGIAMHLGYVPNYPASHGCIRMQNGFAQKMYYWANVGTPVIIKGVPPRYVSRTHHSLPTKLAMSNPSTTVSTNTSSTQSSSINRDPLAILNGMPIQRGVTAKKETKRVTKKRKYRRYAKSRRYRKYHRKYKRHYRHRRHRYAEVKEEKKLPLIALLK